jgi:hypothetical protein
MYLLQELYLGFPLSAWIIILFIVVAIYFIFCARIYTVHVCDLSVGDTFSYLGKKYVVTMCIYKTHYKVKQCSSKEDFQISYNAKVKVKFFLKY